MYYTQDYIVEKWDEVSVSEEFEQCCQEVAAGEYVTLQPIDAKDFSITCHDADGELMEERHSLRYLGVCDRPVLTLAYNSCYDVTLYAFNGPFVFLTMS
jgi:hypothetical protein